MRTTSTVLPKSWLAFELNVLRRIDFSTVSIPLANADNLGRVLKHWNVQVNANSPLKSRYISTLVSIENNGEMLDAESVNTLLSDVYVPQYQLQNASLTNWFSETDSWWFDNLRRNISKLTSPIQKAIALDLGMKVGDYALSFSGTTLRLRQPLSDVFRKLWNIHKPPVNNTKTNKCSNKQVGEFTAEIYTDLLFLRLPEARKSALNSSLGKEAWREEWVRGNNHFWKRLEAENNEQLGAHIETKSQYLNLITELFRTAQHIDVWAIEHIEDGFIQTQDIVEAISEVRRVDTIYSKDFSELMGTKAVIITA